MFSTEQEFSQSATVGVPSPGAISPRNGLIKNSNSTALNGRALDRDLAEKLGRPVRIENDANCFALSEAVDGAGAQARVVFGVILGTGVGGGIVVDRKIIGGRNLAGEWGHNPLPWPRDDEQPGPACYCAKTGCIETFRRARGSRATIAPAAATISASRRSRVPRVAAMPMRRHRSPPIATAWRAGSPCVTRVTADP